MTNCRQSGRFKDWKIKPEDGCRDTDVPWRTPSNVNALQRLKQLLLKSFSLVFMPLLHFSSKRLTLCLWLRCAVSVSAQFQGRASDKREPSPSKTASASSGGWGCALASGRQTVQYIGAEMYHGKANSETYRFTAVMVFCLVCVQEDSIKS